MATGERAARVLTAVEERLVECVRVGEELDLTVDGEGSAEEEMGAWGQERTVRAGVIRDILRGLVCRGDLDPRGVRLRGARIEGRLDLCHVTSEIPLSLATCYLPSGADLGDARLRSVDLRLSRVEHGVRLSGARIGSRVDASGATVQNTSGPALDADGLQVDGNLFLGDGEFTGAGDLGAVRLVGAHVSGALSAAGATMANTTSGPALHADRLQVDGGLFLGDNFTATGAGDLGAVRLFGAHISGALNATGATMRNTTSGPALQAELLQVDGNLFLRDGEFTGDAGGADGVVRLSRARVGRLALDVTAIRDSSDRPGWVDVDGLVYSGLPAMPSVPEWLAVLADRTPRYAGQPYRQLAAATRAAGHDGQTRKILMAQRRDQLKRHAVTSRLERAWAKFTGFTLGYGYQPWRALIGLLTVAAAAVTLTSIGATHGGLVHAAPASAPGTACTTIQRIGVGLDFSLPLIKTGARDTCTTTTTRAGNTMTVAGWLLQLAAWALATLFIAGFTGAVRKT